MDNVETKLDKINQDMNTSQKHINNVKSIFGGIKNWWSGKKETPKAPVESKTASKLEETLSSSRPSDDTHPALRYKSEEPSGYYGDRATTGGQRYQTQGFAAESGGNRSAEWRAYEEQLDTNLGGYKLASVMKQMVNCLCIGFTSLKFKSLNQILPCRILIKWL